MTYKKLYEDALFKLEHNKITLGEFEEMIKPLKREVEQEPILDRDCEHCSKTYGTLGCCTTVSNKWVYSCKKGQREYLLDKIRAEIKHFMYDVNPSSSESDYACNYILQIIDKYKTEQEKA